MKTAALIGSMALALCVHTGCGKKDEDKKAGSAKAGGAKGTKGGGAKGAKAGGPVAFASRTIEMSGFTVTIDVPTGWKEMKFGGGLLFSKPGGIFPSTFGIGETCEGSCSKIAENIKGMTANQVKMHASYYPTAKVVQEGAHPDGGGEFQLDLARKDGSKAAQYKQVRFKPDWKGKAVSCTAMMLKDDAAMIGKFKAACNGMKITVKAK